MAPGPGRKRKNVAADAAADAEEGNPRWRPKFFKVFLPMTSQRLKIPPAFEKHLSSFHSSNVFLKGPSGFTWTVELVRSSEGSFFEDGWKDFVADHSIQGGDFLVFQYDCSSCFSVLIFDHTACEKKATLSAKPCQRTVIKLEEDGEIIDHASVLALPASRSCVRKPEERTKGHPIACSEKPKPVKRLFTNAPKNQKPRVMISKRRPVTEKEMCDAVERAKAFKSKNPSVLIVMAESYVYTSFFLYIPCKFVRSHLPKVSKPATLWDPLGKPWDVVYISYGGERGAFSGGWSSFSVGNNIEKSDVCVFELVKDFEFKVHIFRVVEQITPLVRTSCSSN